MNRTELSDIDFGLIGRPLAHSRSKEFFTRFFAERGLDFRYDNFELPELNPAALYSLVLLNSRLKGFNVTAPYKEAIIPFLDRLTPEAERVGAVNTVKILRAPDGRVLALEGYNTDVEGFRESVRPMAEALKAGDGALILGTGGASKAVAEALCQLGVTSIKVSRNAVGEGIISYAAIDSALVTSHPLIVNATPCGTYPDTSCPPFPYELLSGAEMCHDLVYNPPLTPFMQQCADRGAEVRNGLDMLHRQARAAFDIWTNNQ